MITVKACHSMALLAILAWSLSAQTLSNWRALEDELLQPDKVLRVPVVDVWTNSPTLRSFVKQHNIGALLELSGQAHLGLGRIAGYFALRQIDRELAQEVGLKMALTTSLGSNYLLGAVLDQVAADIPNPTFNRALSRAFQVGPVDPGNAGTLVKFLPLGALTDWFEDPNRPASLLTYEALVLDRMFAEMAKKKQSPTAKMAKTLSSYAEIPGEPRLVYLQWGNTADPRYEAAFKSSLEDMSNPYIRIRGLIFSRAAYIKSHFDLAKLRIDAERMKMMTNDLAQGLAFPGLY